VNFKYAFLTLFFAFSLNANETAVENLSANVSENLTTNLTQSQPEALDEQTQILQANETASESYLRMTKALYDSHFGSSSVENLVFLFNKGKNQIYLKEALRQAFLSSHEKLGEIVEAAKNVLVSDADALRIIAAYCSNTGQVKDGLEHARKLIKLEPLNFVNYTIYGTLLNQNGNKKAAVLQFEKAYWMREDVANLIKLVDAYKAVGDLNRAIFVLENALEKHPKNAGVQIYLSDALVLRGNLLKAEKIYLELYERDKNPIFLQKIAQIWISAQNHQKLRDFLTKYRIDDVLLMDLEARLGNHARAAELAEELYQKTQNVEFRAKKAMFMYEGCDKSEAEVAKVVSEFESALDDFVEGKDDQIGEAKAIYYNYFGYLLIDHDLDKERGLELCLKAYELSPAPYIADSVAWGYHKLGDAKEAKEWFAPLLKDAEFMNSPEAVKHRRAILGWFFKVR